jgi:hypothetical protein
MVLDEVVHPALHINIKIKSVDLEVIVNKGNNKITELRTILQRESQNS